MKIPPLVAGMIVELIYELASEIDMHYDDDEIVELTAARDCLLRIGTALDEDGYRLPHIYNHIMRRLQGQSH